MTDKLTEATSGSVDFHGLQPLTTTDIYTINVSYDIPQIQAIDANTLFSSLPGNEIYKLDSYNSPIYTQNLEIGDPLIKPSVSLDHNGISMDEDCDIKIGDFSVKDSLTRIEKQLGILKVNQELEKDWEELKALGDRYRELEKNIHDKLDVWSILKKI